MTEGAADAAETAVPEQLGPYEILEPLRGLDDWERYLATSGAELVQITVVHPDPGKVSLAARELARAMRQVTAVSGDHVVRTFRAEKNGDATLLITQHLAGRWLREILAGAGRLERGVAMRILLDVASGLAAVHEASAPHGDVRPASVLLGDDGVARLGWLGLGAVAAFLRLPEPVRVARLPYRAPEEQRGRMASAAGDLYSFGVLVHELLVGAPPAPASPSGVTVTVTVDALRNAGLPDAFARFVPRLLSPTPSARPTSARAVREVLEEACTTIPAASREEIATLVRTVRSIHPPSLRDAPSGGDRDETEPRRGLETIELPPAQVPRLPVATVPPLVPSTVRRTMTTPPPRTRAVTLAGPPPIPGDVRRVPPPSPKVPRPTRAVKAPPAPSPPPPPPDMDVDVAVDEASMIASAALDEPPSPSPSPSASFVVPAPAPVFTPTPAMTPMPMPPLHRPAIPPPAVEESIAWSEQGPHAAEPPTGSAAPVRTTPLPPPRRSSAPPPRKRREMPGWLLFLLMLLLGSIGGAYFGLRERARRQSRREGQRHERVVDRTPVPVPRVTPIASPPASPPRVAAPPPPPDVEPPPPEPPPPEPPPSAPPVEVAPPRPPPAPPPTKVAPPPAPPTKVAQPRVPRAPPPTKAPRTPTPRPPASPPTPARGGTLQVSCSVRCEVRVDGAPSAAAAGAGMMVREGSHTVVVTNTATGAVRTLRVYVPTGVRVQRRVGF